MKTSTDTFNPIPFLLRHLPASFAERVFYRFLCGRKVSEPGIVDVALRHPERMTFKVLRGDVIGDSLYYTGLYEQGTTAALSTVAKGEGGLFVDVGANIGYYSVLWTKARQGNRCVAIEASPRNVELIRSNLRSNGVVDACQLLPIAASNESGSISFDQGPESQTGWGGISEGVGSGSRVITVECQPLDELIPEGQPVRLLKIDVEGAEALVLEGMERLLRTRQVKEIWFEDNVTRRSMLKISPDRLTSTLTKHGYRVVQSTPQAPLPMDFVATPAV
jgi:FkbM family methyltransferase